ncbi:uncharacterized protein ATNIH1004_011130 [Aspergillus tanneri]|uniref:Uncharacterized protein n=1 Tax=Aspergillus tanneri TaxID=1220188 RepID=A0A5M9MCC0_9EURO|nr:uncharacterized protein ATNIH1004_011130 [Aspergillus tanneri]KAA8642189.1 hypothetical protein ATNIH1004_011130 [Aspergillus tanneri]
MAHSTDWHQPGVEILDFKHAVASISDIPDAILQAELSHRASIRDTAGEKAECGSTERAL